MEVKMELRINLKKIPRYKIINGVRVHFKDITTYDPKEDTLVINPKLLSAKRDETESSPDFESIDPELFLLEQEYLSEKNPLKKQILLLKYDLLVEDKVLDPIIRESELINTIIEELTRLQTSLNHPQGSQDNQDFNPLLSSV